MCTKVVATDVRALSEKLKAPAIPPGTSGKSLPEAGARGDVQPTNLAPVITHDRPREIRYLRWGLVPAWTQDPAKVTPMYNAKAETLDQLPSFRDLILTRRCLILNQAFTKTKSRRRSACSRRSAPRMKSFSTKPACGRPGRAAQAS